ncbi:IucA/IucC family protein [Marinobacterium lutimaris]|uniref:Siderophore synthetase component n=1 Tax=Marinobacterium lutimaris TaxID=568106 RepID=A0A1H5WJW9_9GAMM|nr:IucA/IucC family protein [Marinobacterium lutimaris]SEF99764.1 Siderophore synthetase component [Marinobacterium lutimaris]
MTGSISLEPRLFTVPEASLMSEGRVIRQLIEALLFEGAVACSGDISDNTGELNFRIGELDLVCRGRRGAFGRLRVQENSLRRVDADGWRCQVGLGDLVAALNVDAAIRKRLHAELEQTVRLCDWNARRLPRPLSRRQLSFEALEGLLDEGHPYHPCFKARTGFSLEDHRRYGPEAGETFALHWLAIDRRSLTASLPVEEASFWRRELGDLCWNTLQARILQRGGSPERYGLMPIHPWQWQALQREGLGAPIRSGEILYLGEAGEQYRATQSIRTLINAEDPGKAHIKLPLNLVNTSSLRTLEPNSVCTAPVLSAWLKKVVDSDPFFTDVAPLILLQEYAGLLFRGTEKQLEGQLGAIWRENLNTSLEPGEQAVPFTALFATELDRRPFIDDWIQRFGLKAWLTRLLECTVLPIWHLLVAQGIALEAHAQNLILVHRDGWPTRLAVRDFHESVEYVEGFLAQPDLCPDFRALDPVYLDDTPDRFFWMQEVEALRELYMDTLYIYNLTELSNLLERDYDVPETRFWQQVHDLLEYYSAGGHCDPERAALLGCSSPVIQTESLLRRKLCASITTECRHPIPNPFHPLSKNEAAACFT